MGYEWVTHEFDGSGSIHRASHGWTISGRYGTYSNKVIHGRASRLERSAEESGMDFREVLYWFIWSPGLVTLVRKLRRRPGGNTASVILLGVIVWGHLLDPTVGVCYIMAAAAGLTCYFEVLSRQLALSQ